MSVSQQKRITMSPKIEITQSVSHLRQHLGCIPTVAAWAKSMGYEDEKTFSDEFRKLFKHRPQPVLLAFRLMKAVRLLRENQLSHYEISRELLLRNEEGLYQFINHHIGKAPSDIPDLLKEEYRELLDRLEKRIIN